MDSGGKDLLLLTLDELVLGTILIIIAWCMLHGFLYIILANTILKGTPRIGYF